MADVFVILTKDVDVLETEKTLSGATYIGYIFKYEDLLPVIQKAFPNFCMDTLCYTDETKKTQILTLPIEIPLGEGDNNYSHLQSLSMEKVAIDRIEEIRDNKGRLWWKGKDCDNAHVKKEEAIMDELIWLNEPYGNKGGETVDKEENKET